MTLAHILIILIQCGMSVALKERTILDTANRLKLAFGPMGRVRLKSFQVECQSYGCRGPTVHNLLRSNFLFLHCTDCFSHPPNKRHNAYAYVLKLNPNLQLLASGVAEWSLTERLAQSEKTKSHSIIGTFIKNKLLRKSFIHPLKKYTKRRRSNSSNLDIVFNKNIDQEMLNYYRPGGSSEICGNSSSLDKDTTEIRKTPILSDCVLSENNNLQESSADNFGLENAGPSEAVEAQKINVLHQSRIDSSALSECNFLETANLYVDLFFDFTELPFSIGLPLHFSFNSGLMRFIKLSSHVLVPSRDFLELSARISPKQILKLRALLSIPLSHLYGYAELSLEDLLRQEIQPILKCRNNEGKPCGLKTLLSDIYISCVQKKDYTEDQKKEIRGIKNEKDELEKDVEANLDAMHKEFMENYKLKQREALIKANYLHIQPTLTSLSSEIHENPSTNSDGAFDSIKHLGEDSERRNNSVEHEGEQLLHKKNLNNPLDTDQLEHQSNKKHCILEPPSVEEANHALSKKVERALALLGN